MKRKWLITTGVGILLAAVVSGVLIKGLTPGANSSKQPTDVNKRFPIQPLGHESPPHNAAKNGKTGGGAGKGSANSGLVLQKESTSLQDTSFQNENPDRIFYRNKVITLMYHEVTPVQENKKSLKKAKFEQQLELMKDNGFQWITMNQYVDFVLHAKPVPPNAVLMTFDDGYESFYDEVYPLLLRYHVPATNFLIVNTIDNPKHSGISKLSWEQIQTMHQHGVDFYSHSYDSHFYAPLDAEGKRSKATLRGPIYLQSLGRKETNEEYLARVRSDLEEANSILRDKLGNTMNVIAFPYGVFSPALLRVCKELDTPVSFTVLPGINTPGSLNGYRVNAGGVDNDPEALIALMKEGAIPTGKKQSTGKSGSGGVIVIPKPFPLVINTTRIRAD
ncbi:polysaccharide deacetylase family protein [Paenibacillus sp. KQZ6P-2]|uniref:Polysaccharide deacetylase family protein n=1 Tax=Paenibacillus mangrovi TaxID=2931978 RepID=A0A9X1WJM9_9BACL|nr:polysaccharide deacetylase family protein [Paenibacillus mangrovi]MCJ8010582.1 polysaccharide deacetylase family protein [Paenibacillus mangrovi]